MFLVRIKQPCVQYQEPEFDNKLKTQRLHQVRAQVEFKPRKTILPPDLFEQFDSLSFWTEATNSCASAIVAKPHSGRGFIPRRTWRVHSLS